MVMGSRESQEGRWVPPFDDLRLCATTDCLAQGVDPDFSFVVLEPTVVRNPFRRGGQVSQLSLRPLRDAPLCPDRTV